jgi:mycothiol synthase
MVDHSIPGFEESAGLSPDNLAAIRALADVVNRHDGLDLKLNWELMRDRPAGQVNDFLVHDGGDLVGYAALDGFGSEYELTGMVHPGHRRRGIGRRLLDATVAECRARDVGQLLLVCEHASSSGHAFIAAQGDELRYDFSEYRLELDARAQAPPSPPDGPLQLRLASAADLPAVAAIRAAAFESPAAQTLEETRFAFDEADSRLYLAEAAGEAVGTIGAIVDDEGVYLRALGVPPELQGRGYGRAILSGTVALMLAEGHTHLALDVATENRNALSLYQSCGFVETNRYDYYAVDLVGSGLTGGEH